MLIFRAWPTCALTWPLVNNIRNGVIRNSKCNLIDWKKLIYYISIYLLTTGQRFSILKIHHGPVAVQSQNTITECL